MRKFGEVDGADFEVVMARDILSETLERVEGALPKFTET